MKAKHDEAGFNDWYQDHICVGSMEMECAKRLWGQNVRTIMSDSNG